MSVDGRRYKVYIDVASDYTGLLKENIDDRPGEY